MPILLATSNAGKVAELRSILSAAELTTPADIGLDLDVEEVGESFAENAALKAKAFARVANMVALADDSGLEVDALGGAPGIYSARYGGAGLDDQARYELLLQNLQEVTEFARRAARFRCCMVAASPQGSCCTSTGICEGFITREPSGQAGFGYDPVFYLPEYRKTMAEIPPEEKNLISHRARAAREMEPLLRQRFPELF